MRFYSKWRNHRKATREHKCNMAKHLTALIAELKNSNHMKISGIMNSDEARRYRSTTRCISYVRMAIEAWRFDAVQHENIQGDAVAMASALSAAAKELLVLSLSLVPLESRAAHYDKFNFLLTDSLEKEGLIAKVEWP